MAADNLIGQSLGKYEIKARLGKGGMGAVYKGFDVILKREVAVKVMDSELAKQEGYLERFTREAQIAAGLQHENIVAIYDSGVQNGYTYIVMQYLTGGSLLERLRQRRNDGKAPMSPGEIGTLLRQIASALDHAHSRGVIHRDIKANNIMFDNQGKPYLVDFGIARLQDATAMTSVALGTPSHMSPEQWGNKGITAATDQYALGVLIYELLAQRKPFNVSADNPLGWMHAHLYEEPTPIRTARAELPEAVDAVLRRAMAKQAEDRFPTVTAFSQAYDRAISGQEGETTGFYRERFHPEPVAKAGKTLIRHRTPTR